MLPDRLALALIGCGGMGRRHLRGLACLAASSFSNVDLVTVCDVNRDNASLAAIEAADLLGRRPRIYADVEAMVRELAQTCTRLRSPPMPHHITRLPSLAWTWGCTCCVKSRLR